MLSRASTTLLCVALNLVLLGASCSSSDSASENDTDSNSDAVEIAQLARPDPEPKPPSPSIDPDLAKELRHLLDKGDTAKALSFFNDHHNAVDADGRSNYRGLKEAMESVRPALLREADRSAMMRDFATSNETLVTLERYFPDDDDVLRRIEAVRVWEKQLTESVPYKGDVAHLFIHSLIVYPELAFDGDYQEPGYRDYMITVNEFERILVDMHKGGFMLVDIHNLYAEAEDGTVTAADLRFPPGKKPFVLSIDDVSYYDYMAGNGFASRLELDDDQNVATLVTNPDGVTSLTLDGDAMPILDQFVLDNPDFSYLGAKGIIALTGYAGLLGYDVSRDQYDEPDFDDRVAGATVIVERMKELGWLFASHSYTHSGDLANGTMSYDRFVYDSDNWEKEIGSIVGPTDIYISPFGFHMSNGNERYRYLIEQKGFNIFNPISNGVKKTWHDDNVVFHRLAIDGYVMREAPQRLEPYFDVAAAWDTARD